MTNVPDKTTERVKQFDACVAELSEETQEFIADFVKLVSKKIAKGAGIDSAKELIWQEFIFVDRLEQEEIRKEDMEIRRILTEALKSV